MTQCCSNYYYPPNDYFYALEIDKLTFSRTGSLKNISQEVCMFIGTNLLLFHVLVRDILYNPQHLDLELTEDGKVLLKQIGAYIYYFFVVTWDEKLTDYPDNVDSIIYPVRSILPQEPTTFASIVYSKYDLSNFLRIYAERGKK